MRPVHAHEIPHSHRPTAHPSGRLAAGLGGGLLLALAWSLPAAGVWALFVSPTPGPLVMASLAYACAFVGWLTMWLRWAVGPGVSGVGAKAFVPSSPCVLQGVS